MNTRNNFRQIPKTIANTKLFKDRSYSHSLLRIATRITGGFLAFSIIIILLLRWFNPPTTSFILQRQWSAWQKNQPMTVQRQWVSQQHISQHLQIAAITSEDQRFAQHWGLDIVSIRKALDEYEEGKGLRGASTITQQVAKNLFLWPGQSYLRKGIEAYFALLIELFWTKERILELYLNIVEFGDRIYGAEAAAQHFFDKNAANLSKWESAFMVTALPAPKRYNLDDPSEYMLQRSAWVLRYMDHLGNSTYLKKMQ